MNKRNLALAALIAVPIVAVAVANPSEGFAANQDWIAEESGLITNPALKGVVLDLQNQRKMLAVEERTLTATTLPELTAIIENEMGQFSKSVSIQYTGDTSTIMADLKRIIESYLRKNDYINGTIANWRYGYKGYENDVTLNLTFNYLTSLDQEAFIESEVGRITKNIIKPTMSEAEKVKAINDYIVLNSTYSYNSSTTPHAVYAILNEGKGVCQAYALLAYRLLREAGFEVRYVTGWAGEAHAWNLVKVDGQWYHLDTTWNDPLFSASSGDMTDYISYEYFLISDSEIAQDHKIDAFGYPNATSDRFVAMRDIAAPVQVGNILYYPSNNDDVKLYKLDLNNTSLRAEKVSDIRVQHLLYANDWLYFSNYSHGGYLYKMELDGSNSTMLVEKKISSLKREGTDLVAYADKLEVYREAIHKEPIDEIPDLSQIDQITKLAEQIVFISNNFKNQAEQLLSSYSNLSSTEQLLVPAEARMKITMVQEKYEKMQTLTFDDTVVWTPIKSVKDAMKVWTVQLSQDVLNTSDNLQQIEVVDMFGDSVNVAIQVDGKTITVTPVVSYIEEVPYTLVIKSGLKNANGQTIKQGVHLQFKVQTK